jgi:RimJ/RimL family protein N-acetyltransferase
MGEAPELRTPRLLLRGWRESDREPFAALNADPAVMAHFPEPLTRGRSDHMIDLIEAEFARNQFGLWALEVLATGRFIGFAGLNEVAFTAHFTPGDTGTRLRRPARPSRTASTRPGWTRSCRSRRRPTCARRR